MSSANCRVHMMAAVFALIGAATPLRAQTAPSLVQGSEPSSTGLFALPVDDGQVITQPAGPPPTPRHTGIKAMVQGSRSRLQAPALEGEPVLGRESAAVSRWRCTRSTTT